MIYLDNAGTTRLDNQVLDKMMPYLQDEYGNASSLHSMGQRAKEVLEDVGALEKAVKLNNGFIDRLCNGLSLSEEYKQIIRDARQELSETRNIQVIKPCVK